MDIVKTFTLPTIKLLSALMLSGGLAACAVGPQYQTPAQADIHLQNAVTADFAATRVEQQWWAQLDDPALSKLIDQGLNANHDLRIALARVNAARAQFNITEIDRWPTVTLGAQATRQMAQQPGITTDRVLTNSWTAGFDAGWELDLWGRLANLETAAKARADAAVYGLDQARVSVVAEIGRNYYLMRGAQQRYAVAERNLKNLQSTLDITQARVDGGQGTQLDVARAKANLANVQATLPPLETAIKLAQYRLAVLTGAMPGSLDAQLVPATLAPISRPIPIGDAADLIKRRPDIAAAERNLVASNADIGAAMADRFPRVSLGGFFGFIASRGGDLGQASSKAWSITPSVDWPAFRLGAVNAQVRANQASNDANVARYEQTVLQAVEETEGALLSYNRTQQRLSRLVESAQQSKRAADIARVQYKEGAVDFLTLLDAERTQLSAEDAMAQAESDSYVELVAVYKALGGGWNVQAG
ncbi:efflux transporter outer membrane subunit [Silvimonas sp. JCM 19000]